MSDDREQDEPSQKMNLGDIYFVLFRHKWMIFFFSAIGVLAAFALIVTNPPSYKSQTTLTIRYVEEGKSLNAPGNDSNARALNEGESGILSTEARILQSFDVALQAAAAFGPEKILAKMGGGANTNVAAGLIVNNLEVELPAKGTAISITLRHPDPAVPQALLGEVVFAYIKKQMVLHQNVTIYGDVLTNSTVRLRSELAQTDEQLKEAKRTAGVTTSVDEAKAGCAGRILKIRTDLDNAEAELAQHQATLDELTRSVPAKSGTTNTESEIPAEKISDYKGSCELLDDLFKTKQQLLSSYTEESVLVKVIRQRIGDTEARKKKLATDYPGLAMLAMPSSRLNGGQPTGNPIDSSTEAIQIRALKSRIEKLNMQLSELQSNAARVDEMESKIRDLQSKREVLDTELKYFSTKLEQARLEAGVGDGKAPNIGTIDSPTPATRSRPKSFWKKVGMVGLGGLAVGVALAFAIELFLDRSLKRPGDVETKLQLPLFISIPDLSQNGTRRLARSNGREPLLLTAIKGDSVGRELPEQTALISITSPKRKDPLRRYFEGLRDRLIVNFEVRNLNQKPKLVGVTSCGKGVGVTTIAVGLATSLSETGDGNVLLVDMNGDEQGASQEFYKGKPGCKVDDVVTTETMKNALDQAHADAASERLDDDKLPRVLPARFASLMPKLQTGHYDYIVFDMPPISQTSMTPRLARIMDMVLLVIESEKTNQDVVKRAISLLAESKVNVSAVLNKNRTYVPTWLHQEFLNEP